MLLAVLSPRATLGLTLLSCSPNFARASITRYTHAKHKKFFNFRLSETLNILKRKMKAFLLNQFLMS